MAVYMRKPKILKKIMRLKPICPIFPVLKIGGPFTKYFPTFSSTKDIYAVQTVVYHKQRIKEQEDIIHFRYLMQENTH